MSATSVTNSSLMLSRSRDTWRHILILLPMLASTFCRRHTLHTSSCCLMMSTVYSVGRRSLTSRLFTNLHRMDRRCSWQGRRCGVAWCVVDAVVHDRHWNDTCCSMMAAWKRTPAHNAANASWPRTSSTVICGVMIVSSRCHWVTLSVVVFLHHHSSELTHAWSVAWNSRRLALFAIIWPSVTLASLTSHIRARSAQSALLTHTHWRDIGCNMWPVQTCSHAMHVRNDSQQRTTATVTLALITLTVLTAANFARNVSFSHTIWPITWSLTQVKRHSFVTCVSDALLTRSLWSVIWTFIDEPWRQPALPHCIMLPPCPSYSLCILFTAVTALRSLFRLCALQLQQCRVVFQLRVLLKNVFLSASRLTLILCHFRGNATL